MLREVENIIEYFGRQGLHLACLLAHASGLSGAQTLFTCAARISQGRKSEVSSFVSVGACNIGRPPRRGSIVNDQNLLTPAAIAGQLNEGGPV